MIDLGVMQLETWEDSQPGSDQKVGVSRWIDGTAAVSIDDGNRSMIVSLAPDQRRELIAFLSEGLE